MSLSIFEFSSVVLLSLTAIAFGIFSLVAHRRQLRIHQEEMRRICDQMNFIFSDMVKKSQRASAEAVPAVTLQKTAAQPPVDFNLAAMANTSAPRAYEVAARLARSGASCEELMQACGLSRHEARLLLRLQSTQSQDKPADKAMERPKVTNHVGSRFSLAT